MPQKRRLKQIERQQQLRERDKGQEKKRVDKTVGSLDLPDLDSEELIEQLRRMRAITPTGVAAELNIKVSVAKRLLEELKQKRIVDLVSRSHNLKVYALRGG